MFNLLTLPLLCFSESVHRNPRAAPSQQLGCLEAGTCLIGLWAAELRSQPRPSLLPSHPEQGRVTLARIPFGSKNQEEAPLVTRLGNNMKWNHFVAGRTGRTVNYSVLQILEAFWRESGEKRLFQRCSVKGLNRVHWPACCEDFLP